MNKKNIILLVFLIVLFIIPINGIAKECVELPCAEMIICLDEITVVNWGSFMGGLYVHFSNGETLSLATEKEDYYFLREKFLDFINRKKVDEK